MAFMSNKDSAIPKKDIDRLCCAKCRFSTKDTDLFERHVSHHEEVTFSCALCSYVSYSKTESQKHVVSHTGSYPYRCSFCSYGAVRRDYMVKHILRIHKRHAEEGFITDFTVSTPDVPETLGISGWPEGNDQCAIPNSQVEHPSGSQPRVNKSSTIGRAVSQTSGRRVPFSLPMPSVTNTTPVSKTQFTSAIPSCTSTASHSLGNVPQVVLRSREENGILSNSLLSVDGQSKVVGKITTSEKATPKVPFSRVQVSSTTPMRQSPRVPERAVLSKTIPRIRIPPPVDMNTPLRTLLNMPKRNVPNVQMDQRASQSTTGINVTTLKTSTNPSGPIRSPQHSPVEKGNQSKTNSRILVGSSAETSSPLSSVQVELLAPLNQPIQHNKPLTVSCPEEINIPAGCLVELVEVKNVNGTRELELRLIPPNGVLQDQKPEERPSPVTTGGKLSFKCQVASTAKGCPVSPSTSSAAHKVKEQQPSSSTDVQRITRTVSSVHKPQCSSEKLNLKPKDPGSKRSAAARDGVTLEGPELSSKGLPVISSVFSLCPSPASTQSKEPKDDVGSAKQSLVCSFRIKKEEELEEKHKDASLHLKETKTEVENTEGSKPPKTCGRVKTPAGNTLNTIAPNLTVAQPLVMPNQSVVPSDKDNISHQDKGLFECESGRNLDCQQRQRRMYPKVALVRIPSSLLKASKKLPKAPVREESLTARPVLCCTLSEQNVSGGPSVAIKLILKRDFRESQEKIQDQDSPPRKKHKKEKRKAKKHRSSSSVETGLPRFPSKGQRELRLTPLKADQLVKIPGPNQPVVVLNHPNPLVQTFNVGVQTLKNFKWIRLTDHEREQPVRKQPSLKMKLKKVHGENYQVVELVLNGLSDKHLF